MTTFIIFIVLSLGLSGLFTYLICNATGIYMIWTGFIFFPILYCLFTFFAVVLFALFTHITQNQKTFVKKPNKFVIRTLHELDFCLLVMLNVSWKVSGYYKIPKDGRFALICNHRSNFDQMILISALKQKNQPLICISKPSNFNKPLAGPIIRKAGYIPIDREDPKEGAKSIYQGADVLKNNLASVNICPEGTRNKDKSVDLLPFHQGSFKVATMAKAPIVIVCLRGTDDIHKRTPFKHTTVKVDVLDTIYPEQYEGMTDKELSDYAYNLIKNDYNRGRNIIF